MEAGCFDSEKSSVLYGLELLGKLTRRVCDNEKRLIFIFVKNKRYVETQQQGMKT